MTTTASGSTFGTLDNTATVTANETDPRPENNTAAQSTRVVTLQKLNYNLSSLPGCPNSAAGRQEGRVYLTSAAPVGGAVVTLTSSNPKIIVPGSVTVEAGWSFPVFDININGLVSAQVEGEITASYAGTSKARAITARPISLKWIFKDPWSGFGGDAAHFTADLECGQSPTDIAVSLTSSELGVAYISTPQDGVLVFSPGVTRRFFTVRTNPVTAPPLPCSSRPPPTGIALIVPYS